jgi:hypothetical protein
MSADLNYTDQAGTAPPDSNNNTSTSSGAADDDFLDQFLHEVQALSSNNPATPATAGLGGGNIQGHDSQYYGTLGQNNQAFPPGSTPRPLLHMPQTSNYYNEDVEGLILNGALNVPTPLPKSATSGSYSFAPAPEVAEDAGNDFGAPPSTPKTSLINNTGPFVTTSSGHKRGPLNGGCFFPSTRPLPDLIPNFRPEPYTGPRAIIKGHQLSINTQQKRVNYNVYSTIKDQHPQFCYQHGITYDYRGRLTPDFLFDRENFASFVKYHPLGKNLWFRLEKFPANCKGFGIFTQDHPTYNLCRARDCPSREKGHRGFHDGTIRVAIEEVLGRIPRGERFENNPYFSAGYLHIDCLENLMDIGQLIRAGMLRPKPREFHPKEPHTSKTEPQVLCPPAKLVTCFEEFCKRVLQLQWDGYLHNIADRLQTYVWLSVQKKGKMTTADAPSDLRKEDALELLKRRPVDPNWGGGRRPGLALKTVKKAEFAGKRRELVGPGTGRNSERAQRAAEKVLEEVEPPIPESTFEDGEPWLKDCYIPLANPELYGLEIPESAGAAASRHTPGLNRGGRKPQGITKPTPNYRPTLNPRAQAFEAEIYSGGNTDGRTITDESANSYFHSTGDGTVISLSRPRPGGVSPAPNQTGFLNPQTRFGGMSTPQVYYPPPSFQMSPSAQQLFFPPIQSPMAVNYGSPTFQDTGSYQFGSIDAVTSQNTAPAAAPAEIWDGTIDPRLLEAALGDISGGGEAAATANQVPLHSPSQLQAALREQGDEEFRGV